MHEDARAERAILSSAEAYRLVEEAREQRERAERAEAETERLRAALQSLWAVTIVGHTDDDRCPYRVGHSPTEHVVFGYGVMPLDTWVECARPGDVSDNIPHLFPRRDDVANDDADHGSDV